MLLGILGLLTFWAFVLFATSNEQSIGGTPDDYGEAVFAQIGLLIGAALCLTFFSYASSIDKKDIYNNQQLNVAKVTHIQGTKNYLITTIDNQKYNFDKDDATINTTNKASAKVTKSTPKSDLDNRIVKAYEKKHKRPENKLTINLTPNMKNTKTSEWKFN